MSVVVFDPVAWEIRYPEFSTVPSTTAQAYFTEATIYQDNTDSSSVQDIAQRTLLLNMLTAHIAAMNGTGVSNSGASPLVGRVATASEGSVSVSTSFYDAKSQTEAWANQTKYGASWWAATNQYRRAFYVPHINFRQYGGFFR